jgi:hypothetical protein
VSDLHAPPLQRGGDLRVPMAAAPSLRR